MKVKKIYERPQTEVVEMEVQSMMLAGSDVKSLSGKGVSAGYNMDIDNLDDVDLD